MSLFKAVVLVRLGHNGRCVLKNILCHLRKRKRNQPAHRTKKPPFSRIISGNRKFSGGVCVLSLIISGNRKFSGGVCVLSLIISGNRKFSGGVCVLSLIISGNRKFSGGVCVFSLINRS